MEVSIGLFVTSRSDSGQTTYLIPRQTVLVYVYINLLHNVISAIFSQEEEATEEPKAAEEAAAEEPAKPAAEEPKQEEAAAAEPEKPAEEEAPKSEEPEKAAE